MKEVDKGFKLGPYEHPPFLYDRVSPIGVAIGKYSGKQRLIVNLSAPHNDIQCDSINSLIDKDICSLSYIKINDAIQAMEVCGKGALLCKTDIADNFKQIPIKPEQWHLFCIKWREQYYVCTQLVFGCMSGPKFFDNLSQAICWIAENKQDIKTIFHLLDDFLTVDPANTCARNLLTKLTDIFTRLHKFPFPYPRLLGQLQL